MIFFNFYLLTLKLLLSNCQPEYKKKIKDLPNAFVLDTDPHVDQLCYFIMLIFQHDDNQIVTVR